ncbi:uncharacterized protein [Paramormyrops kingsleyae]|nr:spermatogenesis- and oogenesis-specific basic helix-loop-helix-containing protein 2 [Paramormyrops kingsleyae]
MTACHEPQKYPASREGINVLLVGDSDSVTETSHLLWETLPSFGEVGLMQSVSLSDAPFVDLAAFQLYLFHLPSSNALAELGALLSIREKQRSDKTVCILIIPELGSDIQVGAADFVLTQPVTVEKMEKVLRGCRLVTERGQSDSRCSMTGLLEPSRQERPGPRRGEGASEHESSEGDDGGVPWRCDSSPVIESNMHALLHSQKEQRRRLQFKKCCIRLRELLPFIGQRLDIASILELTVSYVGYLQQRLPADFLQKVVKALEETKPSTWHKSTKAPRKRKHPLKEKSTVKLTSADEDFADDFIAAHVLGRHIRPRTETSLAPCPVMPRQLFIPPLDPNPTSAHGIMWQPTCPPFSNPMLMAEACDPPEYIYQPPSIFLPGTINPTFAPQLSLDPNSSHSGMLNQFASLPAVLDQNSSPLSRLDPACPSCPSLMMNKSFTVTAAPDELSNPTAVVTQPSPLLAAPESTAETSSFAPATSWMDLLTSQLVHEPSSHVLPSFSPLFGLSNAPPPLQNPNPGFQLSPSLISSQDQWTSSESPHCSAMAHPPRCFSQDSVLLDSAHGLQAQSLTSRPGMAHTSVEIPRMESHSEHHTSERYETGLIDANIYTDKDLTSVFEELVPASFDSY